MYDIIVADNFEEENDEHHDSWRGQHGPRHRHPIHERLEIALLMRTQDETNGLIQCWVDHSYNVG